MYGDCCPDYFWFCDNGLQNVTSLQETSVQMDDLDDLINAIKIELLERAQEATGKASVQDTKTVGECQAVNVTSNGQLMLVSLLVVHACPAVLSPDLAQQRSLCEMGMEKRTVQQHLMVLQTGSDGSPGRLYANIHCALCHGVPLDEGLRAGDPAGLLLQSWA